MGSMHEPLWQAGSGAAAGSTLRRYTAGMPQLALAGLSENWLLKECGDQHWQALARQHGRAQPDFRDVSGAAAYAAFVAVRVSSGAFAQLRENEGFAIRTALAPAGRAQTFSRHKVEGPHGALGTVEMLSAFVVRRTAQDNRSAARAALPGATSEEAAGTALGSAARDFSEHARQRRKAAAADAPVLCEACCDPVPDLDFNGAGFLYFSAFAALVDRAEWQLFDRDPRRSVAERELHYLGNANPGDTVRVQFLAAAGGGDAALRHHARLLRASDGAVIAEVRSLRQRG
jgi:probable biosynthetic protein (TIGR04099 family)